MKNRRLREITWREYEEAAKDGVLIIPIGATEQHSYHLPLGVDAYIARHFSELLADKIDGYVAPELSYGYKSNPTSGGGPLFPGTIDLNGNTLVNLVQDILVEFIKDGWKKIIIMNAHYENQAFIAEAADLVIKNQKEEFPKILVMSWWDNISEELIPKLFDIRPFRGWDLEHAAITETSLMMYFEPQLVRSDKFSDEGIDRVPKYLRYPISDELIPESGALYTSISSSAEKGKMITDDVIENFVDIVRIEFKNG